MAAADKKNKKKHPPKATATDADARLLEHAFRDVAPLPGRKIDAEKLAAIAQQVVERTTLAKPITRRAARSDVNPQPKPSASTPPTLTVGAAPGLDKRTAQRLKRGRLPVDGRIDLHGMTQDQAHRALGDFLATSQSLGRRCVLVITGKGLNPETGAGVLKTAVPRWFNEMPNRGRVLSFAEAQPQDGGGGALYVYLRRSK